MTVETIVDLGKGTHSGNDKMLSTTYSMSSIAKTKDNLLNKHQVAGAF
jgi:hypothetical protein